MGGGSWVVDPHGSLKSMVDPPAPRIELFNTPGKIPYYTPVVFCCRSSVRIVVTEMSLKNLLGTFSGIKNDTTVLFRFNI